MDMGGGQWDENLGAKGTGTLWEVEEERVGGENCQRSRWEQVEIIKPAKGREPPGGLLRKVKGKGSRKLRPIILL